MKDNKDEQALWVQSSEKFPKKRLLTMYRNQPEIASHLLKNIFILPKQHIFSDIWSEAEFFYNIRSKILPLGIKYIVIDNISHHHRYAQANISNIKLKMKFMNQFFNQQVFPLVMFCLHHNLILIFIHEVSFNPQVGQLKAYNNLLFERIKGINIRLSKPFGNQHKSIRLSTTESYKEYNYDITDQGLKII
jgi:hypothetical protein